MPSKAAQCLVLLFVLLQLGEIQGEGLPPGNGAPNDTGVQGECVQRQEFEQLKKELHSLQTTTIRILNRYLLEEPEPTTDGECSNEVLRELQQTLVMVEEAGSNHSREVCQKLAQLDGRLDAIAALIPANTPSNFSNGSFQNPAPSCQYIEQGSPSGRYWIQSTKTGYGTLEYCNMTRECCGSRGGWMRVANLDMTDPNQLCPPGFRRITSPKRTCGRPGAGCVSTTFPVHGVEYKKVCGRIKAYQFSSTNAVRFYYRNRQSTIDDVYVDGVSITHGNSPRKHIWTFVAAIDETRSDANVCPCTRSDLTYRGAVPPFIGQDYFCETGSRYRAQNRFYTHDPLWDGRGCGSRSTCCSFNNPPWFCKELSQPTTDNIELRLCATGGYANDEDIPIELVELHIQ